MKAITYASAGALSLLGTCPVAFALYDVSTPDGNLAAAGVFFVGGALAYGICGLVDLFLRLGGPP